MLRSFGAELAFLAVFGFWVLKGLDHKCEGLGVGATGLVSSVASCRLVLKLRPDSASLNELDLTWFLHRTRACLVRRPGA